MSEQPSDSDKDKTVIRGNDDETNVRGTKVSENGAATIIRGPVSNANATILREPAADGQSDATIIRAPQPEANRTVIREQSGDSDRRGSPQPSNEETRPRGEQADTRVVDDGGDDATVMRDSGDADTVIRENADATVIREDDATTMRGAGDDDATVIAEDDDSTVMGESAPRQSDTTYIASVGKQIESKGNSEAGRLLKNRFVLEEKIGSGGMGDVYKALDLRAQEAQERNPYIAIKLLNENFARHKDAFVSLQREASKTRQIPHKNIMGVYDFDREGDTVFMSMELLSGKPLDDYLKEHPEGVSVEDAWNIIDGICQGLIRAHGAGIVHSDFKPGNIFYTQDKAAKVFDFGIARAVSSPGELEADGEKTVFDAGSLGALTPTYASYEMLKGLQPAKADDVYAVALVAYELFTGKHPYNRTPADKALERGLKPEPVPFLKRRQWKALKKGLELKGEDRTQTVDEFHEALFSEDPPVLRYSAIAAVLLGSIGFGAYNLMFGGGNDVPPELQELRVSREAATTAFDDLMRNHNWESSIWHQGVYSNLNRMIGDAVDFEDIWAQELAEGELDEIKAQLTDRKAKVFKVYMDKVQTEIDEAAALPEDWEGVKAALAELKIAESYLEMAETKKYLPYGDTDRVNSLTTALEVAIQLREYKDQEFAEAARLAEEQQLAAEAAQAERLRLEAEERQRNQTYDAYIAELRDILRCKGNIPSSSADPAYREPGDADYSATRVKGDELVLLGDVLNGLRTTYPARWDIDYENISKAIAGCIARRIAVAKPDRAREVQAQVMTYLPDEPLIANITVTDRDPCDARGLAGRGNSRRRVCVDALAAGIRGPELVVIPPKDDEFSKFAIAKTEIKIGDYNQYCEVEGCSKLVGPSAHPATNLSIAEAEAYAQWLSLQTGREYRLPTVEEWTHAATSNQQEVFNPDANCSIDIRGVTRGDELAGAESGKSNSWGLYHYVGNAREWAVDAEGNLQALGGARTDPLASCSTDNSVAHSGEADEVTGFRLLRQISSS